MNDEAESVSGMESIPRGLCTLIKYHAAKVARDDGEWVCWGAPYVRMCAAILYVYDFTVPSTRQEVLMDPIVLSDVAEAESPGDISHVDPSWSLVRHNKEYFEDIVRNLRKYEHKETLKIVLGLIMAKNFEMGNYDSRVRSIMRNIFGIVMLPLEYMFSLESQYVQCTGPYFNPADISTVGSAVTPFRSLQVCAVALSTGVVMYGVGVFTAPAILMATRQLISTGLLSTSAGQLLIGSGAGSEYAAALAQLLVGMPELCSSAVAGASAAAGVRSASMRMIHRTSPLSEFVLTPLFLPPIKATGYSVDMDTDGDEATQAKADDGLKRQSCLVVCKKEEKCGGEAEDDQEDIYLNSSLVVIEEAEPAIDVAGLKPVYFLVPGHIGNETDLRGIFGGVPELQDLVAVDEEAQEGKNVAAVVEQMGDKIDETAEAAIDSVLGVVEEDVDKLSNLMNESFGGHGGARCECDFLTSPHLVRKNWWRSLFPRGEEYILQWERTELADLNKKIRSMLEGKLIAHAVSAALSHFALTALWGSFAWGSFVLDEIAELDGPWAVALDRSKQAGRILARLLLSNKFCQIESEEIQQRQEGRGDTHEPHSEGAEGVVVVNGDTFSWDDCAFENIRRGRPVTLIGYSMGARVIYHCLAELDACVPNVAGRGIVENVVLMGTPVSTDYAGWSACRRVVSGRLINCYSRKDWFLALMYRTNMYEPTVAGLQPFSLVRSAKFGIESAGLCFMAPPAQVDAAVTLDDIAAAAGGEEGGVAAATENLQQLCEDVECVDVSDIIKSHADYPNQLHAILSMLQLEPPDPENAQV